MNAAMRFAGRLCPWIADVSESVGKVRQGLFTYPYKCWHRYLTRNQWDDYAWYEKLYVFPPTKAKPFVLIKHMWYVDGFDVGVKIRFSESGRIEHENYFNYT